MHNVKTPADYQGLIRVIHERYEDMSKSYQKIALYLTQNPNDVAVLSVSAIADRCGAHASSFVRFGQALGYHGFKAPAQLAIHHHLPRLVDHRIARIGVG